MRVAVIFGTRPEAIKMAPVIEALRRAEGVECRVWSTGQHREMLDQVLKLFGLSTDVDLGLMAPGEGLNGLYARALTGVDRMLEQEAPDVVLVHGDTTTAAAAATAAFHRRIPVGHVEAGLRSGRLDQPWPEEFNRRLADMVSTLLFAPTPRARDNLLAEGADPRRVLVTGNTVIDALLGTVARIRNSPEATARLARQYDFLDPDLPLVLVTGHRRENFGEGFRNICEALARIGDSGEAQVLYPVHLNPSVRGPVHERLGAGERVRLIEPVDYESFVYLMTRSAVILTDSGGVQEEAPSLGCPVLVMRNVTERPEAVEAGMSELVGTDADRIVSRTLETIRAARRGDGTNPYGDGRSSMRIVRGLLDAVDDLR